MPWFFSLCVGFLSLSQEVLWTRYVSFLYSGVPQSFAFVLVAFLFGIAFGSMAGKKICEDFVRLRAVSGFILLVAGLIDMVSPFVVAPIHDYTIRRCTLIMAIFLCAMFKGALFPIVHHLGSSLESGKIGRSVSRVYFCNIVGSTLGPLVTGFFLLDRFGLQESMTIMAGLTLLLGVVWLINDGLLKVAVTGIVAIGGLLFVFYPKEKTLVPQIAIRSGGPSIGEIIENKEGILHTVRSYAGDLTYGGNVYDGRAIIDLQRDRNGLNRAAILDVLHPSLKRVLVIGMSTGSWARLLTAFPGVEKMDVIEINPGYLELLKSYPELEKILQDDRVSVYIDDGRRWLKRNPEKSYDLIVMNTTHHWRAYATNVLSLEFLELVKKHLKKGGIVTFNTTGSIHPLRTAKEVFHFPFCYDNFIIASDTDFSQNIDKRKMVLWEMQLNGQKLLDSASPASIHFVEKTLSTPLLPFLVCNKKGAEVITDWNMITEYKYGIGLLGH